MKTIIEICEKCSKKNKDGTALKRTRIQVIDTMEAMTEIVKNSGGIEREDYMDDKANDLAFKQLYLCTRCIDRIKKDKALERKTKAITKAKLKRSRITETKLDILFSKMVKILYPPYCHSTGMEFSGVKGECHAAHFVSRQFRSTRWDIRNVYPTFASENMFNQLHVISLSKKLKEYYDIDWEEYNRVAKNHTTKLSFEDRKIMYDVFEKSLKQAEDHLLNGGNYKNIITILYMKNLRKQIIDETKIIF